MNVEQAVSKLRVFYRKNKRLPSYSEMGKLFGYTSKDSSYGMANKLIKLGYIDKDSAGKLIPKNLFAIPKLGRIRAGHPQSAEQESAYNVSFDTFLVSRPESSFILTVVGDSMSEAGINDGDIVVVDKRQNPKNMDIVAACVDGEWTLKYFVKENGSWCLQPANPKFQTIYPKESLTLEGVVTGVVRKYY